MYEVERGQKVKSETLEEWVLNRKGSVREAVVEGSLYGDKNTAIEVWLLGSDGVRTIRKQFIFKTNTKSSFNRTLNRIKALSKYGIKIQYAKSYQVVRNAIVGM